MNKRLIVSVAALTLVAGVYYASSQVEAFGFGGGDEMVAGLAQRLGVSEQEVGGAFEAMHQEHQQEMQVAIEERLAQAVADGELSQEQKQLILKKHEELRTEKEAWRQQRQAHHKEMEAWAEEHEIDMKYLVGPGPMGMRQGHHGWR